MPAEAGRSAPGPADTPTSHGVVPDAPVSAPTRTVLIGDTEVTLLGTAHVSRQSAEDVRIALEQGGFDAVAVELCEPRFRHLTNEHDWRELDLLQVIRSGRTGMVAAQLALSAYQKRLADQLGVEPGAEMKAAVEGAQARKLPLWLVDRNIGITMRRVVRAVPWWQRWTLISGLLTTFLSRGQIEERQIESLKEGDLLEATFTEFSEQSPQLYESLVAERDRYMAAQLREYIAAHSPHRVLVVIGAGHLNGLSGHLRDTDDPDRVRRELDHVPPPTRLRRAFPWIVVAIILTGFALGFMRGPELGWRLVTEWVLINGTLSAVGALIAAAHPLAILTAFLAAPLTSLNPTIGAGMVVAAVQTMLSPPHMDDFDTVRDDIAHLSGWWRNRVARVFLVFVLCTLGSATATYIAGFRIFDHLTGG
jgi:pheromone shutdown-related protein TraB